MWPDYLTALGVPWKRRTNDLVLTGKPFKEFGDGRLVLAVLDPSARRRPKDYNRLPVVVLPADGPDHEHWCLFVGPTEPNGLELGLTPDGQFCPTDDPRFDAAWLTWRWIETVTKTERWC